MRRSRSVRRVLLFAGTLVAFVLGVTVVSLPGLLGVAAHGRTAKNALDQLKDAVAAYRFDEARAAADEARQAFGAVERSVSTLAFWRVLPLLGTQYRAGHTLAKTGNELSRVLTTLVDVGDRVLTPVKGRPDLTLATLTPGERAAILAAFAETGPAFAKVQVHVEQAVAEFARVPRRGLLPPVRRAVDQVAAVLPSLADGVRAAQPATKLLPPLIGVPDPVTYLFLLENNTELRPGGGFIGTYGLLTVSNGEVSKFTTDNVYNLDDRVKGTRTTAPPAPLARYNRADTWFLRDSNWSPDFPTDAALALKFYAEEGGQGSPKGVIAVTPTAIAALLDLTGPITINRLTFTSANFVETLQEQVDRGFLRAGLPASERKEIIGDLGRALLDRLEHLPQSRWGDFWTAVNAQLKAKQVLLYHTDPLLQSKILDEGWGGHVAPTGGDTLLVVDANLASLKSDPGVARTLDYTLEREDGGLIARLTVTYRNTGTFTWKTTRYRTYTRIYVPLGSTLIQSDGAERRDRSSSPGDVEIGEELGFTVFGAFKSIEPGETESLSFAWRPPEALLRRLESGRYDLTVFKQPGAAAHELKLNLRFPRPGQPDRAPFGVDVPKGESVRFSVPVSSDLTFGFTL
jgi:hypothetical protein